jgi:hypothetical protein
MKKDEISKVLESAGDAEYILRTKEEEKMYLDNFRSSILESEVGAKSKLYSLIDYDIFHITGVKKQSDEQTHVFLKNQLTALKTKAEKVSELENEITELRKNKPDDAKLQEIKDLQNQIKKIKAQHDDELTEFSKKTQKSLIKSDIERGLMDLKIKAGIPDDVKDVYVNRIIDELAGSAEMRDGQLVFLDVEKKALRNPATMAPYTAKELLAEKMKSLIETGHVQTGVKLPPSGDPVTKKDGKITLNFVRPGNVTSKQKLGEFLVKEMAIKRGSPEYNEAYKTLGEGLPIAD